ncbi:hypothetical protein ABVK25_001103 [Lepraria finkii]|uniref:MoaB/Mog domain-containing protein n=1 Tax=Lepraria finkii TaxID=1340010 RepID=A0ABR4BKW2_9LECA
MLLIWVLWKMITENSKRIREALAAGPHDAFITVGALSVGKCDFVEEGLLNLIARVVFHKVAIRPGHPVLLALFSSDQHKLKSGLPSQPGSEQYIPFFCLPGSPIATVACFRFLVMPYLRLIRGQISEEPICTQLNISEAALPTGSKVLRKPDHLRVSWYDTLGPRKQASLHSQRSRVK